MTGRQRLASIGIDADLVLSLCATHGATNVAVFGSVARGTSTQDSDLDILATLETGRSLFDLVRLRESLAEIAKRPVEVVSRNGLSPFIGPTIIEESLPL